MREWRTRRRSWLAGVLCICIGACSSSDDPSSDPDSQAQPDQTTPTPDTGPGPDQGPQPDAAPPDQASGPPDVTITPCSYTQAIEFIESIEGGETCGASDGTCISGKVTFVESFITIGEGDAGEVYIFGDNSGAPIINFRMIDPPQVMPYKIGNIAAKITDACDTFYVGGRLDVGGNHKGLPGGPEDPVLHPQGRIPINLSAGTQINGIDFTIPYQQQP